MKSVRIGGGLGFYGDSYAPVLEMLAHGGVQYVGFDHLAELTMAILQKDRERDPRLGFARDVVPLMREVLPLAKARGVRLISNAGGLNPHSAARAVAELAQVLSLDVAIGVVLGDDVSHRIGDVAWDGGHPTQGVGPIAFASAYLGALPVKRALSLGADIVLTGRVADSALFLGALAHAFDWPLPGEATAGQPNWDLLAAGSVAGHLLECSGQVTGGNHSGEWSSVPDLDRIGYPIAEVDEEGSLQVTKVQGSGGRVSFDSVREQLLYEVHDPSRYYTPDVTVDLTEVGMAAAGPDLVSVHGVRGRPPLETYKILGGYAAGYLGQGLIGYSWPNALEKARAAAEIVQRQAAARGLPTTQMQAEYLGFDSFHGPLADRSHADELNEVYLRMAMRSEDRQAAEAFARLFPPLALNGPPTASGFIGIDRVRQLFAARAGSLPHAAVDADVTVRVAPAAVYVAETT